MAVEKIAEYSSTSPYHTTGLYRLGLDVMAHRPIPRLAEDTLYTIEPQYSMKPTQLAYELYGTIELWWVFSARNPSVLKDPTFDFTTGKRIYLPTMQTLRSALGI